MAYYKPCKNCAIEKASCLRRAEVRDCISGLSVTVINFRCDLRKPLFHAGQRVSVIWTSWECSEFGEDHGVGLVYHGTVIEECGPRFIVRIDDGPSTCRNEVEARDTFKNENLIIKAKPSDMTSLDEPGRALCPLCAAYAGETSRCMGWGDPQSIDSFWPIGCVIQTERAA
jgi:hypothetical protein